VFVMCRVSFCVLIWVCRAMLDECVIVVRSDSLVNVRRYDDFFFGLVCVCKEMVCVCYERRNVFDNEGVL